MRRREQLQLGHELNISMRGITWFETPGYSAWRVRLRMPKAKQLRGISPLTQTCFPVKSSGGIDEALVKAARYRDSQARKRSEIRGKNAKRKKALDARKPKVVQSPIDKPKPKVRKGKKEKKANG